MNLYLHKKQKQKKSSGRHELIKTEFKKKTFAMSVFGHYVTTVIPQKHVCSFLFVCALEASIYISHSMKKTAKLSTRLTKSQVILLTSKKRYCVGFCLKFPQNDKVFQCCHHF